MTSTSNCKYRLAFKSAPSAQRSAEDNSYEGNVGNLFSLQAVIVIYENGAQVGEVDPIAVQWIFGGASQAVANYGSVANFAESLKE